MNTPKTFKAGDKVYCPELSHKLLTVLKNTRCLDEFRKLMVGIPQSAAADFVYVGECGKNSPYCNAPTIIHATTENHALLEQLYGILFEEPPSAYEIVGQLLQKKKMVACYLSNTNENPNAFDYQGFVTKADFDDEGAPCFYTTNPDQSFAYATPIDLDTGAVITTGFE